MRTMRNNQANPDNSVSDSKHGLQERSDCTAGKNNRVKVVQETSQISVFPGFSPLSLFKYPQISPFLPKYAQISPSLLEGTQRCSRARSPLHWAKGVPDSKELMFGGSDSGLMVAYLGNLGFFWAFVWK